jgi:hypothetical protein
MKGVVTAQNTGKVYFTVWSMDIKIEGDNVVRNLDMTTHNHASFPGNSPPWAYADEAATVPIKDCEKMVQNAEGACAGKSTKKQQCRDPACRKAKRCLLVTYNQGKRESNSSRTGCCPGEQPHHLVEAHGFYDIGERGDFTSRFVKAPPGKRAYKDTQSPCVCASGPRDQKEHGQYHAFQQKLEAAAHAKSRSKPKTWTYGKARDTGVAAQSAVNPQCDPACTKAQLDSYHKDRCGVDENTPLRTDADAGTRSVGELTASQKIAEKAALKKMFGVVSGVPS